MSTLIQSNDELNQEMLRYLQTWAESDDQFPIDFDKAWKWLGYSRKDSAKRNLIAVCENGSHYQSTRVCTSAGGTNREIINMSHSGFEHFCLSSQTAQGRQVRDVFINIKNRHLALRDAITRGDIELRVTNQGADSFGGYIDDRHKARADAIDGYHDQVEAMRQNDSINNRAYHIETNSKLSRAAIGMLPCRFKENLGVPNKTSARDYMDTAQLNAVSFGESAIKNISRRAPDKKDYLSMVNNMTDRLFELCKDYDIHGNKNMPRLSTPQRLAIEG